MITPTRFEVACVGYDCNPDRWPYATVWTKPLVVEARSVREAGKLARAAGWRPSCSKGEWWCPLHAARSREFGTTTCQRRTCHGSAIRPSKRLGLLEDATA